jgi:hypothetical protein
MEFGREGGEQEWKGREAGIEREQEWRRSRSETRRKRNKDKHKP